MNAKILVGVPSPTALPATQEPLLPDGPTTRWIHQVLDGTDPPARNLHDRGVDGAAGTQHPGTTPGRGTSATVVLKVWVVDDDDAVALYLSELLLDFGFEVRSYTDPLAALADYLTDPDAVDVVITDQRMPRLRGDELAQAMLALRPQLRVILCTGYSDSMDRDKAQGLGISGFFQKPFDADALLTAVIGSDG